MKVNQLIHVLLDLNQDADVCFRDLDGITNVVTGITYNPVNVVFLSYDSQEYSNYGCNAFCIKDECNCEHCECKQKEFEEAQIRG